MTANPREFHASDATNAFDWSAPRAFAAFNWEVTASPFADISKFTVPNEMGTNQTFHEGDQLAYWKWFYGQRSQPHGIPVDWLPSAMSSVRQMQLIAQTSPGPIGGTWANVGPAPESSCGTTGNLCSGRVTSVAVDPTNTNRIYLGAAQGGVWRSTDGGATWAPSTDNQPSLAVGSIAVDASGNVYVGTGEGNESCDSYYGAGVLKSTDHGNTWTQLGASTFGRSSISKLIVSGSTVIVATNTGATTSGTESCVLISPGVTLGVYLSTDSGASWTNKLSGTGTDVVFDPTNPSIVYAALSGGVYKSTDGGSTWTGPIGVGFPSVAYRISLAVSTSSPQTVLAAIEDSTGSGALYETTNGGSNWSPVVVPSGYCSGQCWYDLVVAVDPLNANTFYVGGQDLYRTMDGGSNWIDLGGYVTYLHPDQHAFVFSPGSNTIAYSGNDGGIWKSTSVNSCSPASCWSNLNAGLSTLQFQSLATHPTDGNSYFGGTQDNGSPGHTDSVTVWPMLVGGDGGWTAYDRSSPSTMYHTFYGISPQRSDDGGATWNYITTGITTSDSSLFYIPMAMDPTTPTTLYLGTYRLYKTTNRGGAWSLAGLSLGSSCNPCISAIAVAPSNGLYVYVGSSYGTFFVSTDGGATFTERDSGLAGSFVTKIAVDPTNANKVYVTFSGFGVGHVFVSTDSGSTWNNLSSNLPNVPTNAIALDSSGTNVYVGTDIGVFYSSNGGTSWSVLGVGFPTVTVFELVFSATGQLLAATHGRSVWQLSASPTYTVTFNTAPTTFFGAVTPGSITACGGTFTNGQMSTTCPGSFSATANLPTPSTGWQFLSWSWTGGVSCSSAVTNPTSCSASSAGTLTATYAAQISFATNPAVSGPVISWGSCSGTTYANGQSVFSTSYGSVSACYVPVGYTFTGWNCSNGLACSGSANPISVTFTGPGTITLNLKAGSLTNQVSTSLTAFTTPSNPSHGTTYTVSGALTANGVGVAGETIVLVFGYSTNVVTVTTQADGSYTYLATAPASPGSYDIYAFFLGDYGGGTQYLPSTATASITAT